MATIVRMPGVSADSSSAILVDWSVSTGDTVKRGDIIATVETEKAVVDIEVDDDGVLLRTFAEAGEEVAVGGPLAVLLQDGETSADAVDILAALGLGPQAAGPLPPEDEERSQDTLVPGAVPSKEHTADMVAAPDGAAHGGAAAADGKGAASGNRIFATPLVRLLAERAGVSLDGLQGTGPNGRIRRRDLEAAIASGAVHTTTTGPATNGLSASALPATTPSAASRDIASSPDPLQPFAEPRPATQPATAGASTVSVSKFRRAVAGALTRSKQEVPHFYLKATCRADALLALRQSVNEGGSTKITINDLIVKAAALAMRRVPEMNVAWAGDSIRQFETVDIAVAMATERGLVVPVVRSADTRSLSDVSSAIKDLATRAAANTVHQRELEGGVLAISNLGMFGIEEFAAIINPPQVGILAVGAVMPQAVEGDDGGLELARCIKVTLSADHRPVDGALAARWLQAFRHLIENPLQILV